MTTNALRVLVVAKDSAYETYVRRAKEARVRALLKAGDASVARLRRADAHHRAAVEAVRSTLAQEGVKAVFRPLTKVGSTAGFDLVVSVGGDGTLLGVSHAVATDTPVFGVNSAPQDSVGFLCSARGATEARVKLRDAVRGKLPSTPLARMRVCIDGEEVHRRVLNDVLYTHRNPATTARYFLRHARVNEEQKSSGIWVCTASGSTAATRSAGGKVLPARSRRLQWVVREPYHSGEGELRLHKGLVEPGQVLEVHNKMREGALYLDGPLLVVPLEIGQRVRFELSPEPLCVLGYERPSE